MGDECERELSPLPQFTECEGSSFRIVGKIHFKRHVAGFDDDEWYLQNIITRLLYCSNDVVKMVEHFEQNMCQSHVFCAVFVST